MQIKNLALIVAAGAGKRFGGEVPKQYLPIDGETMLGKTVRAFLEHPEIDAVRVVIAKGDKKIYNECFPKGVDKLLDPVIGGAERQDSVRLGLESLQKLKPENVLIHDAARPYVSHDLITRILETLDKYDSAIPVVSVKDSVRVDGKAVNRDEVFVVQTPQGFHYKRIYDAHKKVKANFTDDAQVADAAGVRLHFVAGDEANIKITTLTDLKPQNSNPITRVGMGFDVHAFETGTHVTICGIKIPHSHQLKGHSDADVGLHALVDAILGAIGEGDIGEHFPPNDKKWKNADSAKFVQHAAELAAQKNAVINNVDITIICEEPKLTPYKAKMKVRVAEILKISPDCVNIKATTTEKLGFTGRKEGIAAQAVATIVFLG